MTLQFLLKPAFPKDETVNSLLERLGQFNFGASLNLEYKRLLNKKRASLDCVPGCVQWVAQTLRYPLQEAGEMLRQHTLYDFYACGLKADHVDAFQRRTMQCADGPIRPARLPLLFSNAQQECLHCSECDRSNLERYGFSFVYRQHCIPFVQQCPWHGVALAPVLRKFHLYEDYCRQACHSNAASVHQYATRSAQCVDCAWQTSPYHRDEIVRCLRQSGWFNENNQCALTALVRNFQEKFGHCFSDERLRLLCGQERYITNAIRALERADRHLHPVWCVLLKWFADEVQHSRAKIHTAVKRPLPRTEPEYEEVKQALQMAGSVRKASQALHIPAQHLTALCLRYGLHVSLRPKKLKIDDRRYIEQLVSEGRSVTEVAALANVSLPTVYRVISASPTAKTAQQQNQQTQRIRSTRKQWLKAQRHSDGLSTTQLRKAYPAVWIWLYRHDRKWLEQHPSKAVTQRPVGKRASAMPESLLQMASQSIKSAQQLCIPGEEAPIRQSIYRMQVLTGLTEYALSILTTRETVVTISFVPETRESFVSGRIQWACLAPQSTNPLKVWRLARQARLRPSSIGLLNLESLQPPAKRSFNSKWQQYHP